MTTSERKYNGNSGVFKCCTDVNTFDLRLESRITRCECIRERAVTLPPGSHDVTIEPIGVKVAIPNHLTEDPLSLSSGLVPNNTPPRPVVLSHLRSVWSYETRVKYITYQPHRVPCCRRKLTEKIFVQLVPREVDL